MNKSSKFTNNGSPANSLDVSLQSTILLPSFQDSILCMKHFSKAEFIKAKKPNIALIEENSLSSIESEESEVKVVGDSKNSKR